MLDAIMRPMTGYHSKLEVNLATIPSFSWTLDSTGSPKSDGVGLAASSRGFPGCLKCRN